MRNFVLFLVCLSMLYMNFYIFKNFVSIKIFENFKIIFGVVFAICGICGAIYFLSMFFEFKNPIYKISAFCVGVTFFGFFICFFYDICVTIFAILKIKYAKTILDILLIFGLGFFIIKGHLNAILTPNINEVEIKIKNLKNPLNFALISDLHIGGYLDENFVKNLVQKINSLRDLDAVFIVGDIVDLKGEQIGDKLNALNDLKSKYGTFYVSGNHEFYHGIDKILEKISTLKIKILNSQSVKFADINLAGVGDLTGFKFIKFEPNLEKTFTNVDRNLPTILLSHQPKFATNFLKNSKYKADLILSGHTHAGQIFPFNFLVKLDQKFVYGLYKFDENSQIYVSSGAGFWGPPFRIFTKPEIAYLKLKGQK